MRAPAPTSRSGVVAAWLAAALVVGCNSQPDPARTMNAHPVADTDRALERQQMVAEQIAGRGRDIREPRVLEAMRTVPRHAFVPPDLAAEAYADHPLPIGYGQTISQPYIVAFMTEQLRPRATDRVLEVGTGSGYQAAVLSRLVGEVYTVATVQPLAARATQDLARLGYTNVFVRAGDGYLGWPEKAPFDAIIVTCAPEQVPPPLIDQLKDGGRMMIPVGGFGDQNLVLIEKREGQISRQAVLPVRFVPMTGPRAR